MAKHTLNRLSAKEAERLKKPGRHVDGGGLYFAIDDDGRQRWVFMYVRQGKRAELGLGSAQSLSLAEVRTETMTLRDMLRDGEDPKAVRALPSVQKRIQKGPDLRRVRRQPHRGHEAILAQPEAH